MKQIIYNGVTYNIHPIYDSYACDKYSNIININQKNHARKFISKGFYDKDYLFVKLNYIASGQYKKYKFLYRYPVHKFVWECFNGITPMNGVIEHFDGNKKNNVIHNLKLVCETRNNDVFGYR